MVDIRLKKEGFNIGQDVEMDITLGQCCYYWGEVFKIVGYDARDVRFALAIKSEDCSTNIKDDYSCHYYINEDCGYIWVEIDDIIIIPKGNEYEIKLRNEIDEMHKEFTSDWTLPTKKYFISKKINQKNKEVYYILDYSTIIKIEGIKYFTDRFEIADKYHMELSKFNINNKTNIREE